MKNRIFILFFVVGLENIMSEMKNTNFHLIYNIDSYTNDKHSEALLNPDR